MKIFEVAESVPDPSYFMQEGCAIFALVLHKLIGGSFYIYADAGPTADRWENSGYEYTHVLLGIGRAFYDVRGVRTLPDLAQEFHKNPNDMRLLGPFGEQEFRRRFVGPSDRKPFYPPTPDLVTQAKTIIRSNPNAYGVVSEAMQGFNPRPWLTGKCFDFALALHERIPDAEFVVIGSPQRPEHVALRRGDVFYDARGAIQDVEAFLAHHIGNWRGDPAKLIRPINRADVELHAGVAGFPPPYRGNRDIAAARQAVNAVYGRSQSKKFYSEVVSFITQHVPEAIEIWLHGSRATLRAKRGSDWDFLAIVPDTISRDRFFELSRSPILHPVEGLWRSFQGIKVQGKPVDIQVAYQSEISRPSSVAYWAAREGNRLWSATEGSLQESTMTRKQFVGTCQNSFDEDGDCIIQQLPWNHTSAFAVDEENAVPVPAAEFEKAVFVSKDIAATFHGHHIATLRTQDDSVYMIYDHDTDLHYFFV